MERGFKVKLYMCSWEGIYAFQSWLHRMKYSNNGGMYITGQQWELNMLHPGY